MDLGPHFEVPEGAQGIKAPAFTQGFTIREMAEESPPRERRPPRSATIRAQSRTPARGRDEEETDLVPRKREHQKVTARTPRALPFAVVDLSPHTIDSCSSSTAFSTIEPDGRRTTSPIGRRGAGGLWPSSAGVQVRPRRPR